MRGHQPGRDAMTEIPAGCISRRVSRETVQMRKQGEKVC